MLNVAETKPDLAKGPCTSTCDDSVLPFTRLAAPSTR
jgi:hypothetical protein